MKKITSRVPVATAMEYHEKIPHLLNTEIPASNQQKLRSRKSVRKYQRVPVKYRFQAEEGEFQKHSKFPLNRFGRLCECGSGRA
jgi:hypothetical protein